jgi:hypothetical protein
MPGGGNDVVLNDTELAPALASRLDSLVTSPDYAGDATRGPFGVIDEYDEIETTALARR